MHRHAPQKKTALDADSAEGGVFGFLQCDILYVVRPTPTPVRGSAVKAFYVSDTTKHGKATNTVRKTRKTVLSGLYKFWSVKHYLYY